MTAPYDYMSRYSSNEFKITPAVVISAIGGAIVLIQGLWILLYGESFALNAGATVSSLSFGLNKEALGVWGIIVGASMLVGAFLIATSVFRIIGAVVVIIFSAISVVAGGGWYVGLALGILGAILALIRK